ncbi:helix-turn-helix transcriptional regulator [Asticcacaulis sp. 201]|uniref:helix-turn-helix domain-containing protein n=1 Tax=Asticcacaulis sp. 201 TaxID=3028787 RepID=UPI0029164300|nr:helix-turn-helix transcriptional regulator [Asticcacaulis sp. 201]MDV6332452.1 helix-turn-helix transcriptional regulator [Asticcacaulis sp. 201]
MSTSEPPIIEDEPYQGLYQGARQPVFHTRDNGQLPDRFHLAEILKNTRESLGLSLDEVADITRVRRTYLEAFEQAAYDVLPPRAFAIGYIKAYAKALGLDEETLADMFKREVTAAPTRLHAPSGASLDDVKPNYRLYIGAALCLVAAVVVWNILQRQPNLRLGGGTHGDAVANKPWTIAGLPNTLNGAIFVGQPQPAPQDQDVPAPYVTPGLEAGFASMQAESHANSAAVAPAADTFQMRKAFNPRGAVYGAPPENSTVTIQASKMVNLVVRSPDGTVYFAHSLGAGEAYRVPVNDQQNLLLDVSDATAFDMYYNGEYAGSLATVNTAEGIKSLVAPIGKVNSKASQLSAALDQHQAQSEGTGAKTVSEPIAPLKATKPTGPIPYLPSQRPAATPDAAASSAAPAPSDSQ